MAQQYKRLEDLSDSDEEVHPNIEKKSFRKFVKEQRADRIKELKGKERLSDAEKKELAELEYKALPVVSEVVEDNFRTSKDEVSNEDELIDTLEILFNNFTVDYFIFHVTRKSINLKAFEDLVDRNLVELMKVNDDDLGIVFMKLSMCSKWLREFGTVGLLKITKDEQSFESIIKNQYDESKEAILSLEKSNRLI